jgi:hypothetical protein
MFSEAFHPSSTSILDLNTSAMALRTRDLSFGLLREIDTSLSFGVVIIH